MLRAAAMQLPATEFLLIYLLSIRWDVQQGNGFQRLKEAHQGNLHTPVDTLKRVGLLCTMHLEG